MNNLLESWRELLRGKRKRKDIAGFSAHLTDHILALHRELAEKSYRHGPYHAFKVHDPKPRDIHKARVRDRLVHHAVYHVLYPHFDKKFIFDSYSCRRNKGVHRAMNRFRAFAGTVSKNHTRTTWVLKCDIRKFFASIDHSVLEELLAHEIRDGDVRWLLAQVIGSFNSAGTSGVGLPLGNLTSQLFANVYLHPFDLFVKHRLKPPGYVRYADDFVLLSERRSELESLILPIQRFLRHRLRLELHPAKVFLTTFASGVDFLGWIHFPDHRVLRTATKRRMFTKMKRECSDGSLVSYLGLLAHGNAHRSSQKIIEASSSDRPSLTR